MTIPGDPGWRGPCLVTSVVARGVHPKRLRVDPATCSDLLAALAPLRDSARTSAVGGRYISGLDEVDAIEEFVRDPKYEAEARAILGDVPLAYLSLAALDMLPGDDGLGAHRDYPHGASDDVDPHLSAQFLLSLDGTDDDRAPLWVGDPDNRVVLEPGDLLVFGGNVLHGTHPNTGEASRTSLLWSMGPLWVRPMLLELWYWMVR